ncbi:hypothetical protein PMAYCL1PPCAC_12590 [Pristionchus mayeri]|uniref:RING-type domain-containing protein n=1 Tax=Pristionchus mayeri TaxID=1317129 RepID=A0AAN5CEA9_9BILA|nr:hypothetical protein PMAYCL1PPCAC_12590 [Pristionchus mayeri]
MDLLEQHCTCGVCLDLFDSNSNLPRSLNCGHTFCDRCIQYLKENGDRILRCPSCKSTQYVSTSLPVNYQILGLADDLRTKRETNQRYSLRRPHKDGIKCAECSVPPRISSLRVCRSCESSPLLCPECAITNHNGHSFLSYESFLASKRASDNLAKLESSCDQFKIRSRDFPFSGCSNAIERLKLKCESLSVSPSLRLLSTENPLEAVRQSERFIEVIDRSSDLIAQKLIETQLFFDEQLHSLSDSDCTRNNLGSIAPPVPPRRKLPAQSTQSLNDRYSSGFSIATSLTCIIYIFSFFPLLSISFLFIALMYFVVLPWYSSPSPTEDLQEETLPKDGTSIISAET